MRPATPLAAALLLTAAAASPAQRTPASGPRLDSLLAGRIAGAPVSCLPLQQASRSRVIPGEAIIYSANNRRLYVNRPTGGAEGLTRDTILVSRQPIGQICRGDPIQLVDRVSRIDRGFVTLGDFVPYSRP